MLRAGPEDHLVVSIVRTTSKISPTLRTAAAILLMTGGGTAARAADVLFSPQPMVPAGWVVTVTANGQVGPRYPGSDDFTAAGFPSLSFRRVGEPRRFSTPDDGVSLALYDTTHFRAGLAGRYRGGRYDGSDRRLTGLEDVDWALEPGVFVEYWPFEFLRARGELRHGVGGHHGFVADLGLDLVQRFGAITVSAGPRLALGDQEFTNTYFGVRPFEAALNGAVTPYRPSGGVTSVGLATALSYDWSPQWSTTVSASYSRLVSDAADSPIVKRFGSENQFTIGASVSYSFITSGW
jgi:outer membrane scaffolding protein for murein synthesis (MipA/OmpV family)